MKLFAHVLRADARHFRWLIAGTVLTIAVSTVLDGVWPLFSESQPRMMQLSFAGGLLWLAALLLVTVSVPLVMHTDPLVGSEAFWMTRPVPPSVLLASKTLLLAILVIVVPTVCEVVLMIAHRVPAGDIVRVAAQMSLWHTLWLVVIMAGAAVTSSLARFTLLGIGALVSIVVLMGISLVLTMTRVQEDAVLMGAVQVGVPTPASDTTGAVAGAVLCVASGLVMLVTQARTRLRRWSVTAGVAGVVAAGVVSAYWPWPFLGVKPVVPGWAAVESSLQLRSDSPEVQFDANPGGQAKWRIARAPVKLTGIEPGWMPAVRFAGATLDVAQGIRLTGRGLDYPELVVFESAPGSSSQRVVLTTLLGVRQLSFNDYSAGGSPVILLRLRTSDFNRSAPATGLYRGSAQVSLTREEIVAALPPHAGPIFVDGSYRLVIDDGRQEAGAFVLRVRISRASTVFDRRQDAMYRFFLRNQRLGEAVEAYQTDVRMATPLSRWAGTYGGFSAGATSIRFQVWNQRDSASFRLTQAWLADAELVIVRETSAGSVGRTLEIADFPLREPEPPR